jgi:hypothetical protein
MAPFLSRLLRGERRMARLHAQAATAFHGDETLEVVGESFYQDALWQLVGGFRIERVEAACQAVLTPEHANPHDANAIQVLIEGYLVGYLSRQDATVYLPGLKQLMMSCETGHVALDGVIVGGGQRDDGIGYLGVFLHHSPADFGVAPHYTTGGTLRTGLSQAIATDRADESYDLSWLTTLADDGQAAVLQLRELLANEHDPIDRHYMFCELEERLYRLRETRELALDEFDAACSDHHAEMTVLRDALVAKFGVVPLIEMYRQAAIRWQKEKHWVNVRDWAQRGLDVYGNEAGRVEAVADLQKRVERAASKLEPAPQTSTRAATTTKSGTSRGGVVAPVETLVCSSCGASFDRTRSRGRKPKFCPPCRDLAAPAVLQ